jgi:hypothetical protein
MSESTAPPARAHLHLIAAARAKLKASGPLPQAFFGVWAALLAAASALTLAAAVVPGPGFESQSEASASSLAER